jgi:hypothetical protein
MFTSKGMELRDMGQKVLWAERRSRRGWPRVARSTTGYALCSFLNMADAHGLPAVVVLLRTCEEAFEEEWPKNRPSFTAQIASG